MRGGLDETAINAAFAQPNNDGTFPDAFHAYLQSLARERPSVIFAFPPKAAGTFLRTAAIVAVDGQLIRIVHAQGGRDAQPYLPIFLSYFRGLLGSSPLVAHVHLLALHANRNFFEALNLRPIVMLRGITDMLASYRDMLDADEQARRDGLNCTIPANFTDLESEAKGDFLIDILGPWYVGYYATWLEFARCDPGRVCLLSYANLLRDPVQTLARALDHSGLSRPVETCRRAIAEVWNERRGFRFNRGETGRGACYFTGGQIDRLRRMMSYYPILQGHDLI